MSFLFDFRYDFCGNLNGDASNIEVVHCVALLLCAESADGLPEDTIRCT